MKASSHLTTQTFTLHQKLFSPHPAVVDPVQKRIASLMAMFHFASIPLIPLSLFVTTLSKPDHVPMDWKWVVVVLLCALVNYTLSRSRWYKIAFYAQILAAFCVCYWTGLKVPTRQSVHFVLVLLPVLMAAHLMSYRELIIVTLLTIFGFFCFYTQVPSEAKAHVIGSSFVLSVLLMLILLIRHHHSWVEQVRRDKLAQEYARFQSLMEAAYDTTLTLKDDKITHLGQGADLLFGVSEDKIKGQSIMQFVAIETYDVPHFGETTFNHANGKVRYALYAVEPLQKNESFVALRDITEERLQTIHQLQLDRMSQSATLAAGIAHEFNTPLMVVMNQLHKAESLLETNSPSQDLLNSAHKGLEQLADIVKDLKWFIQTSNNSICPSPQKVIENTVRLANHRIHHQSEIIVSHMGEHSLGISENQLSQLLLNLLFNANEAKSPHQERNTIEIKSFLQNDQFVLQVIDQGVGMSSAILSRAFQPFFTYGKVAGTGLGLAICNSIITQVGGTIEIDSKPDKGTTVTVTIKLAANFIPQTNNQRPTSAFKGLRLVIDDDPLLSELVAEMMQGEQTESLTTVAEALQIIEEHEVGLILCDLNMPNGGARDLYQHLCSMQHPVADRMIIMTGGAVDYDAQAFLNQAQIPILYKPFGYNDFQKVISRLQHS